MTEQGNREREKKWVADTVGSGLPVTDIKVNYCRYGMIFC